MTDRNPAARRRRRVRALTYTAAVLLSLFVLIPIYLITVTAFTPREVSYEFPKPFIPGTVSAETVRFFAGSTGVLAALWRSVVVAALTWPSRPSSAPRPATPWPATPSAARAPTAW